MRKIDFKKTVDSYKARPGEFRIVEIPSMQYLVIDGHGDPNEDAGEYERAIKTLYPVAYTLKFASKELGRDFVVPPLEALWWAKDMEQFTSRRDKSTWDWTSLLMAPDWVTQEMFEAATVKVDRRSRPPSLARLRLERLEEGRAVQTLHVGSYDDEAPVLMRMHSEFIPSHGLTMSKKHHEIYLTDPRKTAPEKLRTILRQPVS